MKEKKNIDELFKDQFQNFEAAPSPAVWDAIEAKLQQKKEKRRVIPLWWRVAGVAALLALLLTVGITVLNGPTNPSNEIVNEDDAIENLDENDTSPKIDGVINSEGTQVASENDNTLDGSAENNNTTTDNTKSTLSEETRSAITTATEDGVAEASENSKISTQKNFNKKALQNPLKKDASTTYNTETEAVAKATNATNNTQKKSETSVHPLVKDATKIVSEKEAVANTETKQDDLGSEAIKIDKSDAIISTETDVAATEKAEEKKKSIFDAIEENKQLEEPLLKKEGPSNRWAVAPNVGPVYYGSLNGGSSIDPMFADNTQSGDINLSYGVQVAYDISDKFSVRSGVNNVNLSYATGDVQVASAPQAFGLKTVDYNNRGAVTTVFDRGMLPNAPEGGGFGNIVPKSTGGNAEISQQLSYYEVPLELKYDLLDNRFGINVIGGMSTLFLGNNEIVVNDGDFRTVLGEANNLNSISFTTNIGLGFNYQLSKKLKFNIEPMFKYQLNPYTDTSIDFRPYYLGVYSGLSFKF
ncbi:MAG: hypothetical protein CMC15_11390 [Flavobacteriaceae bacterium]|nr:hypothetical protein [Flavobacteriaceae bacterium]